MASKMPSEPQHPTVLHPWGCPRSMVIKGDFVRKGVEQFGHPSQDPNLEYKTYSMLLFQKQSILVVPIEKRKGE
jgi:hypothetical protein